MDLPVITELQIMSAGRRSNVLCPTCGSKDRERWIWAFLESAKSDFLQNSNNTILHIAPEVQLRKKFKEIFNKNYINADLNPKHADVKMDITKIQFPDNHFDAILCNHVLEHIPNDQLAMSELHRVLKPKGWAILQVPLSQNLKTTFEDFSIKSEAEREEKFGQFDHVRVYGSDYFKRLENAGFKIEKVKQTSFLSNEQIQSLSLIEGEPIILAIKLAIKLPD